MPPPTTVDISRGSRAGRRVDVNQELGRVYRDAIQAGLGEEGARAAMAVALTEGGMGGAQGDLDIGGSSGTFQFYAKGQRPNFAAAQGLTDAQAAQVLARDPHAGNAWALAPGGYLGDTIRRGLARGLRGSDLATFAQRYGQVSESPERAGQSYASLFQGGVGPAIAAAARRGIGAIAGAVAPTTAEAAGNEDDPPAVRSYRGGSGFAQDTTGQDAGASSGGTSVDDQTTSVDDQTTPGQASAPATDANGRLMRKIVSTDQSVVKDVTTKKPVQVLTWKYNDGTIRNFRWDPTKSEWAEGDSEVDKALQDQFNKQLAEQDKKDQAASKPRPVAPDQLQSVTDPNTGKVIKLRDPNTGAVIDLPDKPDSGPKVYTFNGKPYTFDEQTQKLAPVPGVADDAAKKSDFINTPDGSLARVNDDGTLTTVMKRPSKKTVQGTASSDRKLIVTDENGDVVGTPDNPNYRDPDRMTPYQQQSLDIDKIKSQYEQGRLNFEQAKDFIDRVVAAPDVTVGADGTRYQAGSEPGGWKDQWSQRHGMKWTPQPYRDIDYGTILGQPEFNQSVHAAPYAFGGAPLKQGDVDRMQAGTGAPITLKRPGAQDAPVPAPVGGDQPAPAAAPPSSAGGPFLAKPTTATSASVDDPRGYGSAYQPDPAGASFAASSGAGGAGGGSALDTVMSMPTPGLDRGGAATAAPAAPSGGPTMRQPTPGDMNYQRVREHLLSKGVPPESVDQAAQQLMQMIAQGGQ